MKLNIHYENDIPINAFRWTPKTAIAPLHYHSSLEIGLCLSGSGFFFFGDKRYTVTAGDIFLVNNLERHIASSDESDPSTYLFLNFEPRMLLEEEEALLLPFAYRSDHFDNRIPAGTSLADTIGSLIETIWRELTEKPEGYRSMAKSALLHLCVLLLRHYATNVSKSQWKKMSDSFRRMRPALTLIEERFRGPLDLTEVAAALHISPSRASRMFHQELGRGFKEYLLGLRINEAKRLLHSTHLSVADVCFESGFQSVPSFYRLFRRHVGLPPLEYRSQFPIHAIFENANDELSR
ncbi:AraC family transcriptional regulator [Paenibacillus hodogayensis]|uniref:AraC family transcriptional regulator n=1 Tax=Paenibacillus hodogayensis TaxID=279208 RepID=A0ABV5W7U3_9BACL